MSNEIYPTRPRWSPESSRTPIHNTIVRQSAGGMEQRATTQAYPKYRYRLEYEMLDANAGGLQTIVGFFNARHGRLDDFLFLDPLDHIATDQQFGVGDGVTKTFRLKRAFGGVVEPISAIKGTATIKIGGVVTGAYTADANAGKVTFTVAPAAGAVLTWSGEFYWRARFDKDEAEFEQFWRQLWSLGSVDLITVKTA